jgi:hypothetical protein
LQNYTFCLEKFEKKILKVVPSTRVKFTENKS